ncbi:D-inositol-3-phosphate glycosyltransferase [Thauera mechernichensis]
MPSVYAQADVVILPSYLEGMPHSLLKAGAMGLPVIATDIPGCGHIVTDGVNGLLCEARSVASLRAAIERKVAMRPGQRARLGAARRARVEARFDEQRVVNAARPRSRLPPLPQLAARPLVWERRGRGLRA